MNHRSNARFWRCYRELPNDIRDLADRNYAILKVDPTHRSLHFKKIGELWSARVGLHYRSLEMRLGAARLRLRHGGDNGIVGVSQAPGV